MLRNAEIWSGKLAGLDPSSGPLENGVLMRLPGRLCGLELVQPHFAPRDGAETALVSALLSWARGNTDLVQPGSVVTKASQSRGPDLVFGLRRCARGLQDV